jgi:hypothetical protein
MSRTELGQSTRLGAGTRALLLGLLAGVGLVAMLGLAGPRSHVWLTYGIYGGLVLVSGIGLRRAGARVRRFMLGLGAFMVATLVPYVYVSVVVNPKLLAMPLWEHVWRLGTMLGIGAIVTALPLALGAVAGGLGGGPGSASHARERLPLDSRDDAEGAGPGSVSRLAAAPTGAR